MTFAVIAVVLAFFVFGGRILRELKRIERGLRFEIGERLAARHGLVFLADFDDSVPRDAVSRIPLIIWDANRVNGRFGFARRLDPGKKSVIHFPLSHLATDEVTFAAWFKPRDVQRDQLLFEQKSNIPGFNLTLSEGTLQLSAFDGVTNLYAECGFDGVKDAFTHIAVAVDRTGISVFQSGRESVRLPLERPVNMLPRMLALGVESHRPFDGDVDDFAIWARALSQTELKSIAGASCGIKWKYEPGFSLMSEVAFFTERFIAGVYRAVGRLLPPLVNPAPIAKGVPKITVWPSRADSRHFLFAHEESLKSGFRTSGAAVFRSIDMSVGGRTAKVEVALDDVYGRSDARRMSFIVKDPSCSLFGGCGAVRLYPPELHEVLHPDSLYPLPLSGSFVRLFHEDSFKGLYVVEDFCRVGSAWMARGERDPHFKAALYFHSRLAPCDMPPPGVAPDDAFDVTESLVLSDSLFPWSRQEIRARRIILARHHSDMRFDPVPEPDELLERIIGDSPSPMFVTNDLAFAESGFTWESSNPSLVSQDGHVSRPQTGAPRPVVLTPIGPNGERGNPRRIRVVPIAPDLQTLFIYIGFPVQKHRRSDFVCCRLPAGGGTPEWTFGLGGANGGIKHRGNTSYVRGAKRSFSLQFDEKVDWPGSSRAARHVLLFSGYADSTRLRNKISFDAYRCAASEDSPCGAIDVSWSEIFINGEYFGVWETCRRVKDICDPETNLYKVRARNVDLWKTKSTDMTEYIGGYDARLNPYSPLEELFEFTSSSPGKEFANRVEDLFYIDSVIDFYLMLNFTENFDGIVTNQYIGRRKEDDKWFIVPWDYDKTFFDVVPHGFANPLVARIFSTTPGFQEKVSEKWTALRAGPMSDSKVLGRINADAAMLAPYMEEEYRILQPEGWDGTFLQSVEELRKTVVGRLKMMDEKHGIPAK